MAGVDRRFLFEAGIEQLHRGRGLLEQVRLLFAAVLGRVLALLVNHADQLVRHRVSLLPRFHAQVNGGGDFAARTLGFVWAGAVVHARQFGALLVVGHGSW